MKAIDRGINWVLARKPWHMLVVLVISCVVFGVAFVDYQQSSYVFIKAPR